MCAVCATPHYLRSPSVRGCGLKSSGTGGPQKTKKVTLRARVWVEICPPLHPLCHIPVTLRARVWVEISSSVSLPQLARSPSVRGGGVKYCKRFANLPADKSPSVRGCGLKFGKTNEKTPPDCVTLRARVWVEIRLPLNPTA